MDDRAPDDPRFTAIMLRKALLADGWTDRGLARMVASGQWARVRRGAYVEGSPWRAAGASGRHELRTRAVMAQARTEVVASHASGVPLYDGPVWGLDLEEVHVTRTDNKAGRREAGVRQHCGRLLDGDVTTLHAVPVMSAARLALEVTTVAPTEAALAVVNHLLHSGQTSLEQVRARYAAGIDRWSGTLATDLVLRLANPAISSVGESRTLYLCFSHHLPAPFAQHPIRDERGRTAFWVDFAWPELGVFLEFDGREKYSRHLRPGESPGDAVFREKRREDRIRELTGWRCIRITWRDLEDPARTAARIRTALFGGAMARLSRSIP
ncbi:hypothetical protein G5V58_02710 [Nocardioides anomalus]|uniref:Type IV toxin-antitoxin system AbiEi family antitoxin domain-containing protein n=1 Tax=Nocardioides anomalus TaxID=2712223 RepID=A0A6G6W9C9_9ACTN|nr:hypothetical protein [Nocardioides anomalus]QIG41834.1 hypothetical protein G5V58_02710 [Nocardioides anomalus]